VRSWNQPRLGVAGQLSIRAKDLDPARDQPACRRGFDRRKRARAARQEPGQRGGSRPGGQRIADLQHRHSRRAGAVGDGEHAGEYVQSPRRPPWIKLPLREPANRIQGTDRITTAPTRSEKHCRKTRRALAAEGYLQVTTMTLLHDRLAGNRRVISASPRVVGGNGRQQMISIPSPGCLHTRGMKVSFGGYGSENTTVRAQPRRASEIP
jgi:hypothetical protein